MCLLKNVRLVAACITKLSTNQIIEIDKDHIEIMELLVKKNMVFDFTAQNAKDGECEMIGLSKTLSKSWNSRPCR